MTSHRYRDPAHWATDRHEIVHWLYDPFAFGRRCYRIRWYHRIHLIPARLIDRLCDKYDEKLAAAEYQDAFNAGPPDEMGAYVQDQLDGHRSRGAQPDAAEE